MCAKVRVKNKRALYGYIRKFLAYPSLETFWDFAHYTSEDRFRFSEEFFQMVCQNPDSHHLHCNACPLGRADGVSICEIIEAQELDDDFKDYWEKLQGEIVIAISRFYEWMKTRTAKRGIEI